MCSLILSFTHLSPLIRDIDLENEATYTKYLKPTPQQQQQQRMIQEAANTNPYVKLSAATKAVASKKSKPAATKKKAEPKKKTAPKKKRILRFNERV